MLSIAKTQLGARIFFKMRLYCSGGATLLLVTASFPSRLKLDKITVGNGA